MRASAMLQRKFSDWVPLALPVLGLNSRVNETLAEPVAPVRLVPKRRNG